MLHKKHIYHQNTFWLKIKKYFPANRDAWKKYFKTALPLILACLIFSLNEFVDNFMSTTIPGGNQALSYANSWTGIFVGILSFTVMVGGALYAQYYGANKIKESKEVINLRFLFAIFIFLVFAIPIWITPEGMIDLISGFDKNIDSFIKTESMKYLSLATVFWFFTAIWLIQNCVLREVGKSTGTLHSAIASIIINVILNSIFIFGFHLPLMYLAVATIVSEITGTVYVLVYAKLKAPETLINPLKIFNISPVILKQFFARTWALIFLTFGALTVTVRFTLWNLGYPTGSIGNGQYQIAAATILGISGMIFNIFWNAFESMEANVAVHVGKHLGQNEIEYAKQNANELQGFNLTMGLVLSLILFAITWIIPYMDFLIEGYKSGLLESLKGTVSETTANQLAQQGADYVLKQIQESLWAQIFWMPLWAWFINRSKVINAGGYSNIVSIIESFGGALQCGWIVVIGVCIHNPSTYISFPLAYGLFYLSDGFKLIIYEILFNKLNWARNITNLEESKISVE